MSWFPSFDREKPDWHRPLSPVIELEPLRRTKLKPFQDCSVLSIISVVASFLILLLCIAALSGDSAELCHILRLPQVLHFKVYLEGSLSPFRCTGSTNSSKKISITFPPSRGNWHPTSVSVLLQHSPIQHLPWQESILLRTWSSLPEDSRLASGQSPGCSDCSIHAAQQISEGTAAQNSQSAPVRLEWHPQARQQLRGGGVIAIFLFTLMPSAVFFHPLPPLHNFQVGN